MAAKVLVNLATGMEDGERVLVAFLVATAALGQGKEVAVWTTKDAVRLGLPGEMQGAVCDGCPPLERLLEQFVDGGGRLWLCPICVSARGLEDAEKLPSAEVVGATPMWEWAGDDATVFSY
jgi:predicted peroxiredoxin